MCSFQDNLLNSSIGLSFPLEFAELVGTLSWQVEEVFDAISYCKGAEGLFVANHHQLVDQTFQKKKGCFDAEKTLKKGGFK